MINFNDIGLIPSEISVIRELHKLKQATRVDLVKHTQLSPQSLTRITKKLLDDGLILEGDKQTKQRGQPAINLSIVPGKFISFGIAFEYNKISCSAYTLDGEQLFFLAKKSDAYSASFAVDAANTLLATAIAHCAPETIAIGVGVSVSGFFKNENGLKLVSRNDINGWLDVNLFTFLQSTTQLAVYVENDGRTAALGQLVYGIGHKFNNFFQVLMTRGIGGGFISNNQLIRGFNGNAGEISYFFPLIEEKQRLYRPTEEGFQTFCHQYWGKVPTNESLANLIKQEDSTLELWLSESSNYLKQGLDAITAILDPEVIILAGGLPYVIRQALSDKLMLQGLNYGNQYGPKPKLIVDTNVTDLSMNSALLPVAYQLYAPNI